MAWLSGRRTTTVPRFGIRHHGKFRPHGISAAGPETCATRGNRNDFGRRLVWHGPSAAGRQSDYSDGRLSNDRRLSENRAGRERRSAATRTDDAGANSALRIDLARRGAATLSRPPARLCADIAIAFAA